MSCDWKIYWINEKGELKSQYVIDQNSTQYNSGESGNSTMTLGAAQHMLKMQCNNDTVILDSPQRFAIDRNIKKPTCYKVTQNDNSSYHYGKGLCCVTVTETQLNRDKDKRITLKDGQEVWICDYRPPATSPLPSEPSINQNQYKIVGSETLRIKKSRKFELSCLDKNIDALQYQWDIRSEFNEKIEWKIYNNTIEILVGDEDLIGETFILMVKDMDGVILCSKAIKIIDLFGKEGVYGEK